MKNRLLPILFLAAMAALYSCEKKADGDSGKVNAEPQFQVNISDARIDFPSSEKKEATPDFDPKKLTEFVLKLESIHLKNEAGDYVSALQEPIEINLRDFRGKVKELWPIAVEAGDYTAIKTVISGISMTYDGNKYTASTAGEANVKFNDLNQPISESIVNPFSKGNIEQVSNQIFRMGSGINFRSVRLFFDVESACEVLPITIPTEGTYNFAALRSSLSMQAVLEEGIQQVKYAPPLNVVANSTGEVSYDAIHSFQDFHKKGGQINSHTSQHVFRGIDASLLLDAESTNLNTSALGASEIKPTGITDILTREKFYFSIYATNLKQQGVELESGKTYYFSLRKTWNITTQGEAYSVTRICEPIPVLWP